MFTSRADADAKAVLDALGRSLAIVEFQPGGTILRANENFCQAMGYSLQEIRGEHHRIFCDPDYARGPDYRAFWDKLDRGDFDSGEYKRVAKGGREVWIQASYNPVMTKAGRVGKIVKVATVITAEKLRKAELDGKINAISLVQAVIEFTPAGEILTANENFLGVMGYRLDEVKGQHHRMFVEPAFARSPEYRSFWSKLNRGEFVSASFKRLGKGGKEVWIQASYSPILTMSGEVMKVVKYATDITDLTEIGAGLSRLAENDLEAGIDKAFAPAFEKLRVDFNQANDKLRAALLKIAHSTAAIRSGTSEISQSADDLSRRTEQQAASLEETAAALDEITAAVRHTADGAKHASQVVSASRADAEQSGRVVQDAVVAMGQIEKSSREIGQIIGVIDEIAFQTNLLALNAGVEAARAGEAGRGFAVVASEVRALAQRSAQAAKEIKALITTSSSQVATGVTLVGETGKALGRIAAQVTQMDGIVSEISASAQEQATGLAQINQAANKMDQTTQQNAAMVEETTAASHALLREAQTLEGLIGQFRIGAAGGDSEDATVTCMPFARNPRPTASRAIGKTATRGNLALKPEPEAGWGEF